MKILYIPAENVDANVSRSYFIAKGFSTNHEVYRLHWYDNRNRFWQGKRPSGLYTLRCFIKSYLSRHKVKTAPDYGFFIYSSVFLNAFVGKIIGRYRAIRLMRKHNKKTLQKVVKKLNPDIIYHADGFYFFPALNENIIEVSDLQDDINWKNIPPKYLQEEFDYYESQFDKTVINFIVSSNAAESINQHICAKFVPFDNGADYSTLRNLNSEQIADIKKRFLVPENKTILSYIGGAHKFDKEFTIALSSACLKELEEVHFILAGNLPVIDGQNITNLGFLSAEEANLVYMISDIGITLKNTRNNDFLYHSVPLKFIQYAAARKPIVTFPIKWSEENKFDNIFHVEGTNVSSWLEMIKNVSTNFEWTEELEKRWESFDWQNISDEVISKIESAINNLSGK